MTAFNAPSDQQLHSAFPVIVAALTPFMITLSGCTALSRLDVLGTRAASEPVSVARSTSSMPAQRPPPLLIDLPAPVLKSASPDDNPLDNTQERTLASSAAASATSTPPGAAITAPANSLPEGYLLPRGLFAPATEKASETPATPTPATASQTRDAGTAPTTTLLATPPTTPAQQPISPAPPAPTLPALTVALYISPSSLAYYAAGGVDYRQHTSAWEDLLRRQSIIFDPVTSAKALDAEPPGVLVLPAAVALSSEERAAIARYRERGGSIFASWLNGVRDEQGRWNGFDFMEKVLDTRVVGNTAPPEDESDTFLIPAGDLPVTHSLPAGKRVWIGRPPGWQPLRLEGTQSAARLSDWSYNARPSRPASIISWGERGSGRQASRVVVAGFSERQWGTSPADLEALLGDALNWLLRRPAAYKAAWPEGRRAALLPAIEIGDSLPLVQRRYLAPLREFGWRATLFMLPEPLRTQGEEEGVGAALQDAGHELAYFGDIFEGFAGQTRGQQAERLQMMKEAMGDLGVDVARMSTFRAPMESADEATTEQIQKRRLKNYVAGPDAADFRLPFLAPGAAEGSALAILPRSQRPFDWVPGSAAERLAANVAEFDASVADGALAFALLTSGGGYTEADWRSFLQHARQQESHLWMTTAARVGNWWRERERVAVALDASASPPLLTLAIADGDALREASTVLVDLPWSDTALTLVADSGTKVSPPVRRFDAWRVAINLQGLKAGEYGWKLHFAVPPEKVPAASPGTGKR